MRPSAAIARTPAFEAQRGQHGQEHGQAMSMVWVLKAAAHVMGALLPARIDLGQMSPQRRANFSANQLLHRPKRVEIILRRQTIVSGRVG